MFCCDVTFSEKEVENLLRAVGFFPGTEAFLKERSRRYMLDPDNTTDERRFLEREDWDPNIPAPEPVYSETEVDGILSMKGLEPGTAKFLNEKYKSFKATGAGSGYYRWIDNRTARASSEHRLDVV